MTHNHAQHDRHHPQNAGSFLGSRAFLVCLGFLAVACVLLFSEHRAHLLGILPYLLLLACPLMHLFMHGGHGAHRRDDEGDRS